VHDGHYYGAQCLEHLNKGEPALTLEASNRTLSMKATTEVVYADMRTSECNGKKLQAMTCTPLLRSNTC